MGSPLLPFTDSGRLAGARLCEFATGSSKLLEAHKDWITKYFVPKIRQYPGAWVDLIGDASMLGTADKNLALSNRRIAEVERFIKSQYPGLKFNMRIPHGSSDAASFHTKPADNDGYWRAVLIRWYGVPLPIDTPAYPSPPPSTPSGPGPIDNLVAENGTPINPKRGGRMIDIWGETETPPGFENYAADTAHALGNNGVLRPVTSAFPRPPGIDDKTASDICVRDSPMSDVTLSEIRRIAKSGCRVTIAFAWEGDPKVDDIPGGTTSQLNKARNFFPGRKDIAEGLSGKKGAGFQTGVRKVIVFEVP